jgi:hypothetical protein
LKVSHITSLKRFWEGSSKPHSAMGNFTATSSKVTESRNDDNLVIFLDGDSRVLIFLLNLSMKQFQEFSLLLQASSF